MNIAEILKYCPRDYRLYSPLFGEVTFYNITETKIRVYNLNKYCIYDFNHDGTFNVVNGVESTRECMLFPSKDQRDWSKFRLPIKRGDIMMDANGECPFIATGEFKKDISPKYICGINSLGNFQLDYAEAGWTSIFYIPASEKAKKELFDKMAEAGYKWNANTLELEKMKSEFKEGNVIKDNKNNLYLIVDTNVRPKIGCVLNQDMKLTILNGVTTLASTEFALATEKERNTLYSALVREGYQYDKKQHKLVKQEFKPFDKVLVRDDINDKWSINLFSYYDEEDRNFPYVCISGHYEHCIPYGGNEYLLGTTDSPTCVNKKE